jgi:hypothetical protein
MERKRNKVGITINVFYLPQTCCTLLTHSLRLITLTVRLPLFLQMKYLKFSEASDLPNVIPYLNRRLGFSLGLPVVLASFQYLLRLVRIL